jgi:hypothetical protein
MHVKKTMKKIKVATVAMEPFYNSAITVKPDATIVAMKMMLNRMLAMRRSVSYRTLTWNSK